MSFSTQWQDRFAAGKSQSRWPWSDLVAAVMRSGVGRPALRVLELGCGVGANIPLFLEMGAAYHAIEGSSSACAAVRARFPQLAQTVVQADFAAGIPFDSAFDLIVDRSAVTHNSLAAIQATLRSAHAKLVDGGRYIGIDWFSTKHSEMENGVAETDPFTRSGFREGQFKDVGRVHFSDESHVRSLFAAFSIEWLEEKVVERVAPMPVRRIASWHITARRA